MLLFLLACAPGDDTTYTGERGDPPAEAEAARCPADFFEGDFEGAEVLRFEVDGTPVEAEVIGLCIEDTGLQVIADLLVDGRRMGSVELFTSNAAGHLRLPDPNVYFTITGFDTWIETGVSEGVVRLMPVDDRSDRFDGEMSLVVEGERGQELDFHMTWPGLP